MPNSISCFFFDPIYLYTLFKLTSSYTWLTWPLEITKKNKIIHSPCSPGLHLQVSVLWLNYSLPSVLLVHQFCLDWKQKLKINITLHVHYYKKWKIFKVLEMRISNHFKSSVNSTLCFTSIFKPQYPKTISPNWFPYISLKN